MPNYLERVVAAGARTAALARPPVAAPPRLPGFARPWSLSSEAAEFTAQSSGHSGAGEEPTSLRASDRGGAAALSPEAKARAMPPGTGQQDPALAATPALPVERATPAAGPVEVSTVIQAPPGLRPPPPPAAV